MNKQTLLDSRIGSSLVSDDETQFINQTGGGLVWRKCASQLVGWHARRDRMAYGPPRWSRSKVATLPAPAAHRRIVSAWELEGLATPFLAARGTTSEKEESSEEWVVLAKPLHKQITLISYIQLG